MLFRSQSLSALFSAIDADSQLRVEAVAKLVRRISFGSESSGQHMLVDVFIAQRSPVAVVGPSGAGKSHAVWNAAKTVLDADIASPIYLPLRGMDSAATVVAYLADAGVEFESLRVDPEVTFVLDGWTEFPSNAIGEAADIERTRLLALCGGSRIVVTARDSIVDARFERRTLLPLAREQLGAVLPTSAWQNDAFELLKYPLPLLLHILLKLDGEPSLGRLLAGLHEHASRGLSDPVSCLAALATVSLQLTRRNQGTTRRHFDAALSDVSVKLGLKTLATDIRGLGTLSFFADRVIPIHDSYLDWLNGVGALRSRDYREIVLDLRLREGISLALTGGEAPSTALMLAALELDTRFAAELAPFLDTAPESNVLRKTLGEKIGQLLGSDDAAKRHRGLQAATKVQDTRFDDVVTGIHSLKEDIRRFPIELTAEHLWRSRTEVTAYLSDPDIRRLTVAAIVRDGDVRWLQWLEDRVNYNDIPVMSAVEAALGCTDSLPNWIKAQLSKIVSNEAWRLRPAAHRGRNRELAMWVAENYGVVVPTGSGWFHLNDVLKTCSDDLIYETLLIRFSTMPPASQEHVGFLVKELPSKWLARFQQVAFAPGERGRHHELLTVVSPDTTIATAQEWIAADDREVAELGWRTLALVDKNTALANIVNALPSTFNGIDSAPPVLAAFDQLKCASLDLLNELWARATGTLSPQVAERLLFAVASIRPWGIPSIVGRVHGGNLALPTYHRKRLLQLLGEWESTHSLTIRSLSGENTMSYGESVMLGSLATEPEDSFIKGIFAAYRPQKVAAILLTQAAAGDGLAINFLVHLKRIGCYHRDLAQRLLSGPADELGKFFDVFEGSLHEFPESILEQLLKTIVQHPQRAHYSRRLLEAIVTKPSPAHHRFHQRLLTACVHGAANTDTALLFHCAQLLAALPVELLPQIIQALPPPPDERTVLVARRAEDHVRRLLMDEHLEWLS